MRDRAMRRWRLHEPARRHAGSPAVRDEHVSLTTQDLRFLEVRRASGFKDGTNLAEAHRVISEGKGAVFLHFPRGTQEGAQSSAVKRAANTDTFDAHRRESGQVQMN